LVDLVATLNEGARLTAMADSLNVLSPGFEAARDSLLEIIGRE
jgi:hypothetical protein